MIKTVAAYGTTPWAHFSLINANQLNLILSVFNDSGSDHHDNANNNKTIVTKIKDEGTLFLNFLFVHMFLD